MDASTPRCGTCKFFKCSPRARMRHMADPFDFAIEPCLRHAPTLPLFMTTRHEYHPVGEWPCVQASYWCGDYEVAPPVDPSELED